MGSLSEHVQDVALDPDGAARALEILAALRMSETLPFDARSEAALDEWQKHLNESIELKGKDPVDAAVVALKGGPWTTAQIAVVDHRVWRP